MDGDDVHCSSKRKRDEDEDEDAAGPAAGPAAGAGGLDDDQLEQLRAAGLSDAADLQNIVKLEDGVAWFTGLTHYQMMVVMSTSRRLRAAADVAVTRAGITAAHQEAAAAIVTPMVQAIAALENWAAQGAEDGEAQGEAQGGAQ